MVFIGLLTLHLFLHWSWIVGIFRGETGKTTGIRFALAMAAVLAIIGLAVAMLCAPVENTGEPPHKIRSGEQPANPTFEIDGSMTLHEVEQRTGVPAAVILKELGLPSDLPTDERLGKLRKKHDFKIHDIQNIVQKHLNQQ
jgi:hypothetical protein